jgi:hypothetical protein
MKSLETVIGSMKDGDGRGAPLREASRQTMMLEYHFEQRLLGRVVMNLKGIRNALLVACGSTHHHHFRTHINSVVRQVAFYVLLESGN